MTLGLMMAAWTLVLAFAQILLSAIAQTSQYGLKWNAGPRDGEMPPLNDRAQRLKRAQANLFETLPLFLGAVLIAIGRSQAWLAKYVFDVFALGLSPDMPALPRSLSHVVYFVPDAAKAEAFYARLGFVCTDRFTGVGPFLRPAGTLDHHTLFMIQTPPFMKGCEHFTFHMGGPTEVLLAGTRKAANNEEMMRSVEQGLAGVSLAQQPDWWQPWSAAQAGMRLRAKPLAELIARRPEAAQQLQDAAQDTGRTVNELRYLPLVSSKTLDWVAILDEQMNMVGWAPVDGFD